MTSKPINIALVGLGFGAEFLPIYQRHPLANLYAICQRMRPSSTSSATPSTSSGATPAMPTAARPAVHAVHINTPIPDHAPQSIAALRAGKHVACTVPMATTVNECRQIVDLVRQSGLKYMMMETVVYAREFLFVEELYQQGELGRIQFLQASHQQEMAGWPGYWEGLPPMHYATHCVGPCLALVKGEAEYVSSFGSGRIDDKWIPKYHSPFAVESTHIKYAGSDLSARIYRSLFNTARQYRESFDVYGSKQTFEWPLVEGEEPVLHRARSRGGQSARLRPSTAQRDPIVHNPRRVRLEREHASVVQAGGRPRRFASAPGSRVSLGWPPAAIPIPTPSNRPIGPAWAFGRHESALQGGQIVPLPEFTRQGSK